MGSSSQSNKTEIRRPRKPKSICLPFPSQVHYQTCMDNRDLCRDHTLEMRECYPELFPAQMAEGFKFHGLLHSKKQSLTMRRIKLKANGEQYQIRPSFMMPYMIGRISQKLF